ncbi:MAG: replicative DNA helicase [Leuconostoc pseudomesenteroides]|uniref:replicative DNA helicase n=1 Tax=Leuconostoc pseudomesenteroides TaxID=33968 RepID=UPI001E2A2CAE|nr:replicative DNA helicase [Leuconostoc pseudomesenteroides]MCC7668905.1 replicative DNA helicase [Leuconostoc pseudomesenteroides]
MFETEIEIQLLGAILASKSVPETLDELQGHVVATDFYGKKNKALFEKMALLVQHEELVSPITLVDKNLDAAFIAEVASTAVSSHIAVGLADKLAKLSEARQLYIAAQATMKHLADGEDVQELKDKLLTHLTSADRNAFDTMKTAETVMAETVERIAEQRVNGELPGITTGFKTIDAETSGLLRQSLTIIGARPAVGKTAFALNMAEHAARKARLPVIIFSLEMSNEMLAKRIIASKSLVDASKIRSGNLSDQEFGDLATAAHRVGELPIWFEDSAMLGVDDIRSRVMKLKREQGELGLVIVDYLGLIETGNERNSNRVNEVSKVSRALKILAKTANVPVVVLAQLNRGVEQRQDKRPMLSDLRDSGSIEQDADNVAFLYRDDYYRDENGETVDDDNISQIEFILAKNRNGKRATIPLAFDKQHNMMTDWTYSSTNQGGTGQQW